ncbi:hypothetical protein BT69DRAFT_1277642 [Atractiella rhizophila]|nr:hypothetical protein BT69DRAFT_1277642 [Atractiella rhizophila]
MDPTWLTQTSLMASHLAVQTVERATGAGFAVAKQGTRFGFGIAKNIAGFALGDLGSAGVGVVESMALMGIGIGENITLKSIGVSTRIIGSLNHEFGNDEPIASLSLFYALLIREWSSALDNDPPGTLQDYPLTDVLQAVYTWILLQNATNKLYGQRLQALLTPVPLQAQEKVNKKVHERNLSWEVTREQTFEGGGDLIEAEIATVEEEEEEEEEEEFKDAEQRMPSDSDEEILRYFRRFSKICLGSYGGLGALAFGLDMSNLPQLNASGGKSSLEKEEEAVADAFRHEDDRLNESDISIDLPHFTPTQEVSQEAALEDHSPEGRSSHSVTPPEVASSSSSLSSASPGTPKRRPTFWQLLTGQHDISVLSHLGELEPSSISSESTYQRKGLQMPRFFIVSDKRNKSIIVVIRGSMSLSDLATDLTCESREFEFQWEEGRRESFKVHEGILSIAVQLGHPQGALTKAVRRAMEQHEGFEVKLVGHSLGAGVTSLLGLMWASPVTCRTTGIGGLSPNVSLQVYAFAPPCCMDAGLSAKSRELIHCFVYGTDLISRLSLGHVRDIRSVAAWLCYSHREVGGEETFQNIKKKIVDAEREEAMSVKKEENRIWLASMRTTLEANMMSAELYPPGDTFWLLHPNEVGMEGTETKLYRVHGKIEQVFSQILFDKSMLSSHMPHNYVNNISRFC